jgi:UTP--glucose-1-phosphate uridylyltransferase
MMSVATTIGIKTAVIPVAGVGSRFAPASFYVPKELLPIYDTPALQYVISEALSAGMQRIVLVSSRNKPAIETFAKLVWCAPQIEIVYQDEPNGLGHAVGCARDAVAGEPFVVLLPDEIMSSWEPLQQMCLEYMETGESVVMLQRVPQSEVSKYGIAEMTDSVRIKRVVEKPAVNEAPSDLAIIGRYVLGPEIMDYLLDCPPGALGEVQLTDALQMAAEAGSLRGFTSGGPRWDTGNPMGLFLANYDHVVRDSALVNQLVNHQAGQGKGK